MRRALTTAVATAVAAGALAAPASAAESLYATTEAGELINFSSDEPRKILSTHEITGLEPYDFIFGLDFRPADGRLYGLGRHGRIYTIDPATGAASAVARETFDPQLNGKSFGFDFNPVVDRIRLVSDLDQNLRLNPNDGKVAAVDKKLAYEVGTSTQHFLNPDVVASAYTNSVAGATTTQLYGLDTYDGWVVIQDPPNEGTIKRVGRFGTPIGTDASFDIAQDGTAYAAFQDTAQRTKLYRVDLTAPVNAGQPAAEDPVIGKHGGAVTGLAVAPPATSPVTPADPKLTVRASAKRRVSRRSLRKRGLDVGARCSEACRLEATLSYGATTLGQATEKLGSAGFVRMRVRVGRRALPGRGRRKLILRVTATDGSGNTATARRGVVAR
jgi:Domain of unknown function (DUF4394)